MSKTTSNSITQRIVGAVVLLALIALIAILLFQPSDKLPSTDSKGQRPTTTAPEITVRPGSDQAPPIIVLESTPGNQGNIAMPENVLPNGQIPDVNAPSVEVVDEAIWQQVEQTTGQVKPPAPANNRPIAQGFNASTQAVAPAVPTHNNTAQQKPNSKPNNGAATANTAKNPEPTPPKLELVSSSQASQNRAPSATQNSKAPAQTTTKPATKPAAQGGWYVQLGAFGKAENAQKTYNQYKQLGYNVRIQKENNIHRVQVGPYASKEAAEQIKTRTQNSKEGINPSVIRIP